MVKPLSAFFALTFSILAVLGNCSEVMKASAEQEAVAFNNEEIHVQDLDVQCFQ